MLLESPFACIIATPPTAGASVRGVFQRVTQAVTYFDTIAVAGTAGTLRTALGLPCNISTVAVDINAGPAVPPRAFTAANNPLLRCDVSARKNNNFLGDAGGGVTIGG